MDAPLGASQEGLSSMESLKFDLKLMCFGMHCMHHGMVNYASVTVTIP
jgi:hypothetical protein